MSKFDYEKRAKLAVMLLDPAGYKIVQREVGFIIVKIFFGGCFTGIIFAVLVMILATRYLWQ